MCLLWHWRLVIILAPVTKGRIYPRTQSMTVISGHCRQYPRGPLFRKARALDSAASRETRRPRRAAARSARLSDAVLRSADAAGRAGPAAIRARGRSGAGPRRSNSPMASSSSRLNTTTAPQRCSRTPSTGSIPNGSARRPVLSATAALRECAACSSSGRLRSSSSSPRFALPFTFLLRPCGLITRRRC